MLYPRTVFEDQGDEASSGLALAMLLGQIEEDMLGFAGVEIHRRILGLAHNADFETIEDADVRAACEAKALRFATSIIINAKFFMDLDGATALARNFDEGIIP